MEPPLLRLEPPRASSASSPPSPSSSLPHRKPLLSPPPRKPASDLEEEEIRASRRWLDRCKLLTFSLWCMYLLFIAFEGEDNKIKRALGREGSSMQRQVKCTDLDDKRPVHLTRYINVTSKAESLLEDSFFYQKESNLFFSQAGSSHNLLVVALAELCYKFWCALYIIDTVYVIFLDFSFNQLTFNCSLIDAHACSVTIEVLLLQSWGKNCSAIKFRPSTQHQGRDDEAMPLSGYSYNSIEDAMDVATARVMKYMETMCAKDKEKEIKEQALKIRELSKDFADQVKSTSSEIHRPAKGSVCSANSISGRELDKAAIDIHNAIAHLGQLSENSMQCILSENGRLALGLHRGL
ncbi:hypothetical protein TRIUR3_33392 [Triticum urartu]|uniref:Uncharacterized protein n=1 Tax=Triticum urartu TaxID=4572 RepID=M8ALZ8_TRIUA|nr:hypothetical protein TRIUR3_33392 [Triticum urartu]